MSAQPQKPEFVGLYERAFKEFGVHALWNFRALDAPSCEDALIVARALRIEGDLTARRLAEADRASLPCRCLVCK